VLASGIPVKVGTRTMPVDVAFGGAFYAIVDSEAAGVPILPERLTELRQVGMAIKHASRRRSRLCIRQSPDSTASTARSSRARRAPTPRIFVTSPSSRKAKSIARRAARAPAPFSPFSNAMGIIQPGDPFVHESIIGTTFSAKVVDRTTVGDLVAIVPELTGSAWITGEHTFIVSENDPLRDGFSL
jgi:proline racemase